MIYRRLELTLRTNNNVVVADQSFILGWSLIYIKLKFYFMSDFDFPPEYKVAQSISYRLNVESVQNHYNSQVSVHF